MNRYKFRGKRLDNGEWVYGNLFVDPDTKHCTISGYDYYTDSEGLQREPFDWAVNPETVGQWTGLKDKNGVEIYEQSKFKCVDGYAWKVCYADGAYYASCGPDQLLLEEFMMEQGVLDVEVYEGGESA